jgi:hypothetical protein
MSPTAVTILRAIVNAQRASDSGKGIEMIPESDKSSHYAKRKAYGDKNYWILSAIRQIRSISYAQSRCRFYVEQDHQHPNGDAVIVYFLVQEVNDKGKRIRTRQISFHCPYVYGQTDSLYAIRKYLGKTPRIRWNKRIGESRENCLYFALTYGV